MNQPAQVRQPIVLVAPLDWGLGHATRCIPLIHALLKHNCRVVIAAEGKIRQLLQTEFPHVEFWQLQGYNIRYSRKKWLLPLRLISQVPRLLALLKKERAWLKELVEQKKVDAVISDNRYGLHHPDVPSVFITHQLRIQTFCGEWADDQLQKIHYHFIKRFNQCWVPDHRDHGLAGKLSHPKNAPSIPVHYLGTLSRFSLNEGSDTEHNDQEKHLLVLLSGPEPQRSLLEERLLKQITKYQGKVVWVRGLPGDASHINLPASIEVHNHLPAELLKEKMRKAGFIISRCGYSTVMDVAALQKKAIFIPTPGQTEQEYLAKHLMQARFALCIAQSHFSLQPALDLASAFPYQLHASSANNVDNIVREWVEALREKLVAQNQD